LRWFRPANRLHCPSSSPDAEATIEFALTNPAHFMQRLRRVNVINVPLQICKPE
jgi:hypothetical protein